MIRSSYRGYNMGSVIIEGAEREPLKVLEERKWSDRYAVQMFDPSIIASERQIVAAFLAAVDSIESGTARSNRLEIEFLLRLSAESQINQALRIAGVKENQRDVGVVVFCSEGLDVEECVKEVTQELRGNISKSIVRSSLYDVARIYGLEERAIRATAGAAGIEPEELLILEKIATSRILE